MTLRQRIADWLRPRERLTVHVEEGEDGRWRWYAHTYAEVLVAQCPPDGFPTETLCTSTVRKLFGNGWRVGIRVEYRAPA